MEALDYNLVQSDTGSRIEKSKVLCKEIDETGNIKIILEDSGWKFTVYAKWKRKKWESVYFDENENILDGLIINNITKKPYSDLRVVYLADSSGDYLISTYLQHKNFKERFGGIL